MRLTLGRRGKVEAASGEEGDVLEAAETGHQISREDYDARLPSLRVDLVNLQYDLRDAPFAVLVQLAGDDRLGIADTVNRLNEWMDARFVTTHVFRDPSEEERQRPWAWRLWRATPALGEMAVFVGADGPTAVRLHLRGEIDEHELDRRASKHRRFLETLAVDRTLMLRIWLHLPKDGAAKRLKKARRDSALRWRVDERDWELLEQSDRSSPVIERYLRVSSSAAAPWHIIESTHGRTRDLRVAELILGAVRDHLAEMSAAGAAATSAPAAAAALPAADEPTELPVAEAAPRRGHREGLLDHVDLAATVPYEEYQARRDELQARLHGLSLEALDRGVSTVLAFEGWDAAGKGGTIRRITKALEAGEYRVVPIAAPTPVELAHHYLWRFWLPLPRAGRVLIFDRSWYGRVLVERVERLAPEAAWRRAYDEINDFEASLCEHGTVLAKFWLHVSEDEQRRRFAAREDTDYKKYKITEEDYRNQEKREPYRQAVEDMFARTSTDLAPWTIVAAEDKRWARLQVLEIVCERLAAALGDDGASG